MLPSLLDIIDICLVALLLYGAYRLMKSSGAVNIFFGVLAFIVLWVLVTYVFKLKLFGGIMDKVVDVGVLALIILFQNEIRQFLVMLGSRNRWTNFVKFFSRGEKPSASSYVSQIALACEHMSRTNTGALIVVEKKVSLEQYEVSGERLDAEVSSRLIENIFFKNTPLHDGALIVSDGRLAAAACILPVASNTDIPKSFGLRHRSALGIAQQTDAVAIVVSEETGHIAIAHNGVIIENRVAKDIEDALTEPQRPAPVLGHRLNRKSGLHTAKTDRKTNQKTEK